ncbi:hypothetical protein [Proteus faecis]|uniref:hypothetical protein n=1 Tax=Proteus faecis TaxID=2050967 RepID=UPI003075C368
MPKFYTYSTSIKKELENKKIKPILFYEIPFNILYVVKNISPFIFNIIIKWYFLYILHYVKKNNIKEIFIIRGRFIPVDILKDFMKKNEIKIKVYQWDSFQNNPNAINLSSIIKEFYSFDFSDCEKYKLSYLPLFYSKYCEPPQNNSKIYFVSFIGSYHGDRYKKLITLKETLKEKNLFIYLYLSPLVYIKMLINGKAPNLKNIRFRKLSYEKMLEKTSQSTYVIDLQSEKQTGITIRTYEALAMGCKVYSTNKNIESEFPNTDMVEYIQDLSKINFHEPTLKNKRKMTHDIKKYSISNWLKHLGY